MDTSPVAMGPGGSGNGVLTKGSYWYRKNSQGLTQAQGPEGLPRGSPLGGRELNVLR